VTVQEGWLHDKAMNAFLKTPPDLSPAFPGSRLIGSAYTGQSGQFFGGDCDTYNFDNPLRHRACNPNFDTINYPPIPGSNVWPGWWHGFNSTSPDGSKFDEDIANMREGWWIDERCFLMLTPFRWLPPALMPRMFRSHCLAPGKLLTDQSHAPVPLPLRSGLAWSNYVFNTCLIRV